jgi:hypothetical protein
LIVMQRIVLFSATVNDKSGWNEDWIQRTRSLLTLSLVSRSFYACATPFLYRDIRISPLATGARLSNLWNTLNISIKSSRTVDHLSCGYGYYTKTFVVYFEEDCHSLPADIRHLLDKMTKLHTLIIRSLGISYEPLPVHPLSSVVFQRVDLPLILDQGMVRALLPFQRLHIHLDGDSDGPMDLSQVRQVPQCQISRILISEISPRRESLGQNSNCYCPFSDYT